MIKTWAPPTKDDDYPEIAGYFPNWKLEEKKKFGIALSGGGMRAASNALGWLSAFNEVGALSESRYVSVNSGASWVTLIALFAFAARLQGDNSLNFQVAMRGLLRESGPKNLAKAAFLKRVRQGFRSALESSNRGSYYLWLLQHILNFEEVARDERDPSEQNFWCRAVKEFMSAHEQTDPEYIAFKDNFDKTVQEKMPYFIVAGSMMQSSSDGEEYCLPFEFTPNYCGVPVLDATIDSNAPTGFIEPFAFKVDYGTNPNGDKQNVTVNEVVEAYFSDVSGISSSAVVQVFYESFKETWMYYALNIFGFVERIMDFVTPKYHFWAPKKEKDSDKYVTNGGEFNFSDGGAFDNTASLNLLRRGVKNIAICYSSAGKLFDDKESTSTFEEDHYDLMALFGLSKDTQKQVFDKKEWGEIKKEMKQCVLSGNSTVAYRKGIQVQENMFCGVRKYTANILFVLNDQPKYEWEHMEKYNEAPPGASGDKSSYFKEKPFDKDFPFISFKYMSYTESLTEKLADNTYNNLVKNPKLKQFLADVEADENLRG
eukprot:gene23583-31941_t